MLLADLLKRTPQESDVTVNLKAMPDPVLEVRDVECFKTKEQPIFSGASFTVNEGDVVVLQGKSGAGKSTLLKCLAHLNLYEGEILFRGRTPVSYGIPNYRTRVLYVPQRPSLLPGTPRDFLSTILTFNSLHPKTKDRKKHEGGSMGISDSFEDAVSIAREWGIAEELWDRNWSNLSGGEAQRISLAVAVGLRTAEILLLDEPTSALDADSSIAVEQFLTNAVRTKEGGLVALVWITHSTEQSGRVGTRFLRVSGGSVMEERPDSGV